MPAEKCEILVTEKTTPVKRLVATTDSLELEVIPSSAATSTKVLLSMSLQGTKVPPTGSPSSHAGLLSHFLGENRTIGINKVFVFSISKVEVRLEQMNSTASTAKLYFEFEAPGAEILQPAALLV